MVGWFLHRVPRHRKKVVPVVVVVVRLAVVGRWGRVRSTVVVVVVVVPLPRQVGDRVQRVRSHRRGLEWWWGSPLGVEHRHTEEGVVVLVAVVGSRVVVLVEVVGSKVVLAVEDKLLVAGVVVPVAAVVVLVVVAVVVREVARVPQGTTAPQRVVF